jgi:hypothetical protein
MFCSEVMALCCKNHRVECIGYILCGQNTKILSAAGVTNTQKKYQQDAAL